MSNKISPCPFCNGEADMLAVGKGGWVRCQDCGAEGPTTNTAEAIEAWNRRTPAPPSNLRVDGKAIALATMISERMDFNLRTDDLWSDAAKIMAAHILEWHPSAPKAWLTEWVFKNEDPKKIKHPGGGSSITRDEKEAAEKLAFYQSWDRVEAVVQTALFAAPSAPEGADNG